MIDQSAEQNGYPEPSLRSSLVIQQRVIGALLLREIITRYGRHNIGFLWLFVDPMLLTIAMTLMWTFFRTAGGGIVPATAFALTGASSMKLWRILVSRCMKAITPSFSLMYHRNVRVLDIFAARIILEIVGGTVSFVVLALAFISIGWMELPADVLEVAFGWALLAWFSSALGLTIGSLSERFELVSKVWTPVTFILMPISGTFFMVDWLPPDYRALVLLLPMVHGVEILREGYFGDLVPAHYDVGYLTGWCMFLSFLGLALVREASRRVGPQ
jgi:capsular polysaccharide transport system permease protein